MGGIGALRSCAQPFLQPEDYRSFRTNGSIGGTKDVTNDQRQIEIARRRRRNIECYSKRRKLSNEFPNEFLINEEEIAAFSNNLAISYTTTNNLNILLQRHYIPQYEKESFNATDVNMAG